MEFDTRKLALNMKQNLKLKISTQACSDSVSAKVDIDSINLQRETINHCIEQLKKIFDPIIEAMKTLSEVDETDVENVRPEVLKIIAKLEEGSYEGSSDFFQSDRFKSRPKTGTSNVNRTVTVSKTPSSLNSPKTKTPSRVKYPNVNKTVTISVIPSSPHAPKVHPPSRLMHPNVKAATNLKVPPRLTNPDSMQQKTINSSHAHRVVPAPSSFNRLPPSVKISKTKFIGTRPNASKPPLRKKLPLFTFSDYDAKYNKIYREEIKNQFDQHGFRIAPFIWSFDTTEIPDFIIENDILYVATILVDYNIDDLPIRYNYVVGEILKTAKNFIKGSIKIETATLIIRMLLKKFDCISDDFYQTFIFSRSNELFSAYRDAHEYNEYIRATRFDEDHIRCPKADDNLSDSERDLIEAPQINSIWDDIYGDTIHLEELCKKLLSGKVNQTLQSHVAWGDVKINGVEVSNDGRSKLAFPGKIEANMRHKVANIESLFGSIPPANIATETINEAMRLIPQNLSGNEMQRENQLSQSQIFRKGIKYLLSASALNHHTFFQARGSEMPQWFPGFYFVFPDSIKLQPTIVEPSQAMFHAWRSLAPFSAK